MQKMRSYFQCARLCACLHSGQRGGSERQFVKHNTGAKKIKRKERRRSPPGETLRDVMPAFSPNTLCTSKCLAFRDK